MTHDEELDQRIAEAYRLIQERRLMFEREMEPLYKIYTDLMALKGPAPFFMDIAKLADLPSPLSGGGGG